MLRHLSFRCVAAIGAVLSAPCAAPAVQAHQAGWSSAIPVGRPCAAELAAAGARCLGLAVPEDRATPERRTISLNIVLLPSVGPRTLPPLFDLDGGPGLGDTKNAAFYAGEGAAYRNGRDIVLVDQRGTGASNGLHCPELAAVAEQPMFPPEAVAACRDRLSARADLRFYGTEPAVEDLDAVRRALGYDRIDLFGLSYGTTVALRYMARFPDRVRAAVLMAAAPPFAMPPRFHAAAGERALQLLIADCAADSACAAAFPALYQDAERLRARLDAGSAGPAPELVWERLRTMMYSPAAARRVPLVVHAAANGDLAPWRAAQGANAASLIADGMYLSVTCGESFGAMDVDPARREARATRFGDYRLRRQQAACALWPRATVPADFLAMPRTRAAVLLVSGRLDPVTPPEWAERVAAALPNARHLVIPQAGHVVDGLSGVDTCFDPLVLEFLRRGDAAGLDTSCVAAMRPPPFQVAPVPRQAAD